MTTQTELGVALQAAYESIFDEKELPLATGGKNFPTRPDQLTDRQIAAIFRYGKRALNDAYNGEAKTHRDAGQAPPDPQEFFDSWFEDLGTNKPRGGGARLTVEIAGWIEFFNAKNSPIKFKGEKANGKNLIKYQDAFVSKAIWPSVRSAIKDLSHADQVEFHKNRLPELVQKHKPEVIARAEADKSGVGAFIDAEKQKRAGTTSDQFQVEIDIQL